jgi:hypothetical protein
MLHPVALDPARLLPAGCEAHPPCRGSADPRRLG